MFDLYILAFGLVLVSWPFIFAYFVPDPASRDAMDLLEFAALLSIFIGGIVLFITPAIIGTNHLSMSSWYQDRVALEKTMESARDRGLNLEKVNIQEDVYKSNSILRKCKFWDQYFDLANPDWCHDLKPLE